MTNTLPEGEISDEFRMILSHAFLGCDTSDISRETFDLAISECVKYAIKLSTPPVAVHDEKAVLDLLYDFYFAGVAYLTTHSDLNDAFKEYTRFKKLHEDEIKAIASTQPTKEGSDYWKKRCEAAERVMDTYDEWQHDKHIFGSKEEKRFRDIFNEADKNWQSLKQQTPR